MMFQTWKSPSTECCRFPVSGRWRWGLVCSPKHRSACFSGMCFLKQYFWVQNFTADGSWTLAYKILFNPF